jgi:hypothetical protein
MFLRLRPLNRWLEPALALVVLGGLVRAFIYFQMNDHFPQPFFYEPFDVWMDWFNTAYWGYEKGAYDAWGTVYPPVSFVFLRIFSLSRCYHNTSGYVARECDWVGLTTMFGVFLLNVLLLWFTFRKFHRKSALWRTIALGLGLPALYGLERGNLVIVCFTFVILGFGPLLKSARQRWVAVALAINFKVYVIAALFPQLLRRRWLWFEGSIIATIVVYLITFAAMGSGTPQQLLDNITGFSGMYQAITFLDLWYAATYKPLMSLITGQSWMVNALFGQRLVNNVYQVVFTLHYATMGSMMIAALAAWFRPEVVPMHRLTFFGLAIATLAAEPGGYTETFLIFFIFLESWKGFARSWSIFASYILCLPFDIILDRVAPTVQESYLAGHTAFFSYYVTAGPFLRPALILSIGFSMAILTISQVWSDIRRQGWRSRWRYRLDNPILPGIIRPDAPVATQVVGRDPVQ